MLSHNLILHIKTKHINFDIHFVRERVVKRKINIQHVSVSGLDQIVYALTKFLSNVNFQDLRTKLKIVPLNQTIYFWEHIRIKSKRV